MGKKCVEGNKDVKESQVYPEGFAKALMALRNKHFMKIKGAAMTAQKEMALKKLPIANLFLDIPAFHLAELDEVIAFVRDR